MESTQTELSHSAPKEAWSPWRKANYAFFKKHLEPIPRAAALVDLGAGPVQFSDLFFQFAYTGVDFEKYEHVRVVTDLTKPIPLPDQSADVVTLSNTLEHIPNGEAFIRECYRLLKSGGHIIGTIPFLVPVHQAPYDFNRYTYFQLERLLSEAGFKNVSVEPLGGQIDVYNTIELKVFEELRATRGGLLLECVRFIRRVEMRLLRALYSHTAATKKVTEGYGFTATK